MHGRHGWNRSQPPSTRRAPLACCPRSPKERMQGEREKVRQAPTCCSSCFCSRSAAVASSATAAALACAHERRAARSEFIFIYLFILFIYFMLHALSCAAGAPQMGGPNPHPGTESNQRHRACWRLHYGCAGFVAGCLRWTPQGSALPCKALGQQSPAAALS